MDYARTFLKSVFGRSDDEAALSRRDILAGIGLAGLLAAAPKLLAPSVAEAKPVAPEAGPADAARAGETENSAEGAAADSDVTDLSAQRYWRRRYWRRRYWRRRYYWRPRYYRRRYWRRRYWRRRYWY
jgi:hypothetical protein